MIAAGLIVLIPARKASEAEGKKGLTKGEGRGSSLCLPGLFPRESPLFLFLFGTCHVGQGLLPKIITTFIT